MPGHDDDLSPWNDDPLVRALRGPGTSDELAGQDEFLAAFRAAQPTAPTPISAGRLRRAGRRLGGGGSAVVVVLALGAGAAAAAYTQSLPDPVQRAVHGVLGPVGVPAPEPTREEASRERGATPSATSGPGAPSTDSSPGLPVESPSDSPSSMPTRAPSETPSATPTETPTDSPTPTPTEAPAPVPSAVSLAGSSHRAGPDDQVPMVGNVSASDTSPVPGQEVALQQRVAGAWTSVASATSDEAGSVSVAAPTLARTSSFRLTVGDLTSTPWRVVLVPTLDVVSRPDSGSTAIAVSARGGRQGDRVELLRRRPGDDVLVARARLAADLTTTFRVASPNRRVAYVARLPRTRAHARARDAVVLRPLTPVAVSAAVPDSILGPQESVTVSGTVTADGGIVLPDRKVWLLLREAGGDWRRVGSATSDASGSVAIAVGPIERNVAVRLRVGRVRSTPVPLRLQPEWTTSVATSDASAVVSGTALGGNAGDIVLLRQVVGGRLVTVRQATLTAAGTVRFEVPVPEGRRDRYRVVLERTPQHLRTIAPVVVRPVG
ncbi:hypothetical protein [Nocardioides baculatus]|uniref:Uncharacterized protein n=1 Tax=Nocardioides baculatus TaxID=2801337 RepID=A0ABS1LBZ1_9ACTN|nr:hypothetical protein [Nocardioides baculatus]MBL0748056.1 hypothetical protein [Nocardioides baculatus]